MSGGHWGYMSTKLEDRGRDLKGLFDVLAAVEHEMDWAICADTCTDCARLRVWEGMKRYFDGDYTGAIAVLRDGRQNRCEKEGPR